MANQGSLLQEFVLVLLDPDTTPEYVLQLLSLPWLSPMANSSDDDESVVIFLACIRFITDRSPGVSVEGIWEDILRMTVRYSYEFSAKEYVKSDFRKRIYLVNQVNRWLDQVLSDSKNCPNPYIRLELFRLLRQFSDDSAMDADLIFTFIETISEIEPHRLYPTGNVDDVLFGIVDLNYIVHTCNRYFDLQKIISHDLIWQTQVRNQVLINSEETRFLINCVKLLGVFAVVAGCNTNPKIQRHEIRYCLSLFRLGIGNLVNLQVPDWPDKWAQFCSIFTRPPFRSYVDEAVRDISSAVNKIGDARAREFIMSLRDLLVSDLSICNHTCDLPKSLMSQQLYGSTEVKMQAILIAGKSDEDDDLGVGRRSTNHQRLECIGRIDRYLESNETKKVCNTYPYSYMLFSQ